MKSSYQSRFWTLRSAARGDGAQAHESGGSSLTFVVGNKSLDWAEVESGGDMDGVQGPQRRLGERTRTQEQVVIDGSQRDAVEELARAFPKLLERELGVHG